MPIFQLVQFANEVKKVQKETKPADIAVCRALGPWLSSALESFGQSEEDVCAGMVGVVSPSSLEVIK